MKYLMAALSAALFASASHAGETAAANPGLSGFLDPKTGTFTARPAPAPEAVVVATATLTVNFSVKIKSSIPSAQSIYCSVYIVSLLGNNVAQATGKVTKTSASAGTCTVSIPYIWNISSTSETMSVSTGLATVDSSGQISRYANNYNQTLPIPRSGVKTIAVTAAI